LLIDTVQIFNLYFDKVDIFNSIQDKVKIILILFVSFFCHKIKKRIETVLKYTVKNSVVFMSFFFMNVCLETSAFLLFNFFFPPVVSGLKV
jgi:hypothetical protein